LPLKKSLLLRLLVQAPQKNRLLHNRMLMGPGRSCKNFEKIRQNLETKKLEKKTERR